MVDQRVMETMFRLLSDALKGVDRAQDAFKALSELPPTREALVDWAKTYAPNLGDMTTSQLFGEQLEDWFRVVGFVPRRRYLEVLERCEKLRERLEETERATEDVKATLDPAHAATRLIDTLGKTVESTLRTQSNWLKTFLEQEERTDDDAEP